MQYLIFIVCLLMNSYYLESKEQLSINAAEASVSLSQNLNQSDSVQVVQFIDDIKTFRFSEPEKARLFADSALVIARSANLKFQEAEILNQLGIIASVLGDAPSALENFLAVLRVREEIQDLHGIARIQNNIGILYKNIGDLDKSLNFHNQSLRTKKILDDSLGIARSLNNIGEIHLQKGEITTSKGFFDEALGLMLTLDFEQGKAAVFNNLGEVYKLQDDINTAISYHTKSLEIEKEQGNIPGIGYSYLNIASLFLLVDQPEIAIKNYEEAITYFEQINDLSGLKDAYKNLAATYSDVEAFEESLYYFQLHASLKDSLVSIETNRQIAELQTQYESEKQKQEIELLNERSRLQVAQLEHNANTRNMLFLVLALLVVIAIVLFRTNRISKKANELLRQKNKEIEEAARLKTQFLSVMSHEIRTPMNAVIGMTNLLANENPREDQKEYLDTLDFSAKNLLEIVNDVLDYNRVESGKVSLEVIEFKPLFLFSNVYQSFYHQAVKKNIHLTVTPDEKIPEVLKGDPTRLTQILNNLISNAIKFTETGSVTVDVSLSEQTESTATLEFRVSDTGIGIPADKVDIIFESFIQASEKTHRKYGGSGLGLAITKKLLELHGSQIKVVSTVGKGTTFSFSVTYLKAEKVSVPNLGKRDLASLESLEGAKVLVVEDNLVNTQVLLHFLKRWDITPKVCTDGKKAIEAVKESNYDVVLMDLHMPIMDGYEATKRIRLLEDKSISTIPIVALTASNVFEEHAQAFDAGVNEIVPKPFEPSMLHEVIQKYLGTYRSRIN